VTSARILIADDHEVVRKGVRSLLEQQPGWSVCGEANTGRMALAMAAELHPDVVVLDASMPELNGVDAARQIRRVVPAKILILTMHDSAELMADAIDAGAQGFVLKSKAGQVLVDAISALLQGAPFAWSDDVFAPNLGRIAKTAARQKSETLTPRQREVLQLLSEGKSNKEIGTLLGITTKTAETHRADIMARLQLHSIADLVRYAIRNRMTDA
jgi:DNA-binding NarL/FixJ family response regulator